MNNQFTEDPKFRFLQKTQPYHWLIIVIYTIYTLIMLYIDISLLSGNDSISSKIFSIFFLSFLTILGGVQILLTCLKLSCIEFNSQGVIKYLFKWKYTQIKWDESTISLIPIYLNKKNSKTNIGIFPKIYFRKISLVGMLKNISFDNKNTEYEVFIQAIKTLNFYIKKHKIIFRYQEKIGDNLKEINEIPFPPYTWENLKKNKMDIDF